jgi:organic radical activating enzyme
MKYKFSNKVEFYITNVCNLTCNNCNRFNNFNFKGHQRWEDYAEVYQQWSDLIELQSIVVMGGEPLLNPTIKEWVVGLADIFNCDVQILTNGLQLNRVPGLYDTIKAYANDHRKFIHLQVSLHNLDHFDFLRQQILTFLDGPCKEWGKYLNQPAPKFHRDYQAYYTAQDKNNVQINMHVDNSFFTSAVQLGEDGRYRVHNSDPLEAHSQCGFVRYKSYHFIEGGIYKCGPAALLPKFDQQLGLDLTDQQRAIMNAYQPFTVEQVRQQGTEILTKIDQPIEQCQFCPTQFTNNVIWPDKKSGKPINI